MIIIPIVMEVVERSCCVRGYHVYKDVWDAAIGEELDCQRETCNSKDRYAVAVLSDGIIVGHLPRKISRSYSLFIRRGGSIVCRVTGKRRYSADLPQGGLEIPCILVCSRKAKEVRKLLLLIVQFTF